jgi:hypothetical protein
MIAAAQSPTMRAGFPACVACRSASGQHIRDRLILLGKIAIADGLLSNSRADFEILSADLSSRERAESGAKGGRKRAENEAAAKETKDLAQAELKPKEKIREEKKEGETNVSPRGQGFRLPDDWEPRTLGSDTIAGQIVAARGHAWAVRALESFRNHWRSANGPNARKRDWQAAWANWAIEQDNRDGRRTNTMGRNQSSDGLSSTARAAIAVFGPTGPGVQRRVPQ